VIIKQGFPFRVVYEMPDREQYVRIASYTSDLRRHPPGYANNYNRTRRHLALQKDCPEPRDIQPPDAGPITSILEVGGLHHR
jgi:hypothetical protein